MKHLKSYKLFENYGTRDKTDMYISDGDWTLLEDGRTYKDIRERFGISDVELGEILEDLMEQLDMNYQVGNHRIGGEEVISINLYPNTRSINHRYNWRPDGYDIAYYDWIAQKMPNLYKPGSDDNDVLQTIEDRLNDKGLTMEHTDNRHKDYEIYARRDSASITIRKKKKKKSIFRFWEAKRSEIDDIAEDIKDIFADIKDDHYKIKVLPQERMVRRLKDLEEGIYSDPESAGFANISIDIGKHKKIVTDVGYEYWTDADFDANDILPELQRVCDYLKGIGAPWIKIRGKLVMEDSMPVEWDTFMYEIGNRDDYVVSSIWIYTKIDIED